MVNFYREHPNPGHVFMFKGWDAGEFGETIRPREDVTLRAVYEDIDLDDETQANRCAFVTYYDGRERVAGYVLPRGIRYKLQPPAGYGKEWTKDGDGSKLYKRGATVYPLKSVNFRTAPRKALEDLEAHTVED